MNTEISSNTIIKLGHEILEIRIRALENIENKLLKSLQNIEETDFNPTLLVKWLIRWFGQNPLCKEDAILNLIIAVLSSKYAEDVLNTLGVVKLKKELDKIGRILQNHSHKKLLHEIYDLLRNENKQTCNVAQSQNGTSGSDTSSCIHIDLTALDDSNDAKYNKNYVEVWETPGPSDLISLKLLKTSLKCDTDEANIEHALNFLDVALNDFPAEYFLQPPYIFESLKNILDNRNGYCKEILKVFSHLTRALQKRVKMRIFSKTYCWESKKPVVKTQLSLGQYCFELFKTTLDFLREIYDKTNKQEINQCYVLMLDIIDLLYCDIDAVCQIDDLLNDLGYLCKFFRSTWDINCADKTSRNQYIIVLFLICKIVTLSEKKNRKYDQILHDKRAYDPTKYAAHSFNLSKHDSIDSINSEHETNSMCKKNMKKTSIWQQELETALFDYPLEQLHSKVHEHITAAVKFYEDCNYPNLAAIRNCWTILMPAIELLREPNSYNDEDMIYKGIHAIDTLSLHKSVDLVKRLFQAISNSVFSFDGNSKLKKCAEELLLRLIAHEDLQIKRTIYQLCSDKIKYYFSSLMDGETLLSKNYATNTSKSRYLGIPLTTEILTEIVCFGYSNEDNSIQTHAELILTLILKSKHVLRQYWENILEILIPTMPLLQCYASKNTSLGRTIVDFLNPDNKFPLLELIRGNIRLLFNSESLVRDEAISRVMYLLLEHSNADCYLPNINNITDIIPNNICVLDAAIDPFKNLVENIYEKCSIYPLIQLLDSKDVEPSIKKTTLNQLNVMAQDPCLNEIIHEQNGLFLILNALENSLKENHTSYYPDSAIPAIGIISKLCLQITRFRREISKEVNIYLLLLRALLLFHQNITFKVDCAMTLFILVYSEYSIGSNQISLPYICSKLKVPFKFDIHLRQSNFNKKSLLEELLLEERLVKKSGVCNMGQSRSRMSNYSYSVIVDDKSLTSCSLESKIAWQYIRLLFASMWFNGFENIIDHEQPSCTKSVMNYSKIPTGEPILSFDKQLYLTKNDLSLIKATAACNSLKESVNKITNATSHADVLIGISEIENYLLLPREMNSQFTVNELVCSLKRFCTTTPNSDMDIVVFGAVIMLLGNFVERDFTDITIWILQELQKKNCIFINTLTNVHCSSIVFAENCRFIGIVLKKSIYCKNQLIHNLLQEKIEIKQKKNTEIASKPISIINRLFEIIFRLLEDKLKARELDKLRSLLTLLRIVTSSRCVDVDDEYVNHVSNKLLYLISTIKSLAQSGSNFNKNCLLTIGNLIAAADEVKIDSKYLKLLCGLCGHTDLEIRTFSWSIFVKQSQTLRGATQLINELSYLPGGFHTYTLSTLLNPYEISIIRESAGFLFSNLLSYHDANRNLDILVAPKCAEQEISPENNVLKLIIVIIKQQRFYDRLSASLKYFWVHELADLNECDQMTTYDIVKSNCILLSNLVFLKICLVDELYERGIILDIVRLIPSVLLSPHTSSISMMSEICQFMTLCFQENDEILNFVSVQEHAVINSLLKMLDVSHYEQCSKDIKTTTLINILNVVKALTKTSFGYQLLCSKLEENQLQPFLNLIVFGLQCNQVEDFSVAILELLTSLLMISQSEDFEFKSFANLLDSIDMPKSTTTNSMDQAQLYKNTINENHNPKVLKTINDHTSNKMKNSTMFASELIYSRLYDLFDRTKNKPIMRKITSKTIELLLKCSPKVRCAAKTQHFLCQILDELEAMLNKFGMACSEFIRRHGDTKKEPVINAIKMLYGIILSWYSADCLQEDSDITQMCYISIKLWPWACTNYRLQLVYMQTLAILSEDSVPVCRIMAGYHPGNSQSVLQIVSEYAIAETTRPKHPQANLNLLQTAMRIITNCCSCIEGRLQLTKINILDCLNRLHPTVTKQQKSWNAVTLIWLNFYEIFTRYPEGNSAKHLSLLCTFILKTNQLLRCQSLVILRNMSFGSTNKTAILASDEFLYVLKTVIEKGTSDEQLLVVTSIWKLIANNYKGKHYIKNSSIPKKLFALQNLLYQKQCNESDLCYIVEILVNILNK